MPERSILSEISGNRVKNGELSIGQRQIIIDMALRGAKRQYIADLAGCSRSAVTRTLQRWNQHSTTSLQRSGRPKIASPHAERILYRSVQKNLKATYKELAQSAAAYMTTQRTPSRTFLYYLLKRRGLIKVRSPRKTLLEPIHARKRRVFAHKYRYWQWHRRPVRFSDECSVKQASGGEREWSFTGVFGKFDKPCITEVVPKGKQLSQMVWGSI